MKRLIALLLLSLCSASAQMTSVSGTVTDPDSFNWKGGSVQFALYNPNGGVVKYNGVPLTAAQLNLSLSLNSSGAFTGSVNDNSLLTPIGTQWKINACPLASAPCQSIQPLTITGGSQVLTSTINSQLQALRFAASPIARAYGNVEISPTPPPGGQYYDLNVGAPFYWNGTSWIEAGSGGTIAGSTVANQGVGAGGSNNTLAAVPETGYETVNGVTTYTCNEDHNKGDWDVRCRGWASNPSTAIVNTIHDAMCYYFQQGQSIAPIVHVPSGIYSVGGNIGIPPQCDVEGPAGMPYGESTQLNTADPTQPMFTNEGSMTFSCGGSNFTANNGVSTIGGIVLNGAGSGHSTDIGLLNATGGTSNAWMHNMGFTNFGGAGRDVDPSASGQDSGGTMIFFAADDQWYYNSGQYNPTGFTDTNAHCAMNLTDLDSHWDHFLGFGQLQDSGFYNRYYLSNVCLAGGQGSWFKDSFIQIAPHNIWYLSNVDGDETVDHNRLDDAHWDAIHLGTGASGNYMFNLINGFCTSPTLNPANFATNPGGVSTDPACSAIGGEGPDFATGGTEGMLSSRFLWNQITQDGGLWPNWPVWDMFFPNNVIGQVPSTVMQPPNTLGFPGSSGFIGGALGYNNVQNPGADVSLSLYDLTQNVANNTGGTLHFNYFKHLGLQDTSATTYNAWDGLYNDVYVTINIGANDSIANSSTVKTCGGTTQTNKGITTWWVAGPTLIQGGC